MYKVFGVQGNIDVIKHHGSTDPLILIKVLEYYGVPKPKSMMQLKEFDDIMCEYFHDNRAKAGDGLAVLPGVTELLDYLQPRDDVRTCLVTGNMERLAWMKIEAMGLLHRFSDPRFGGFGSDHCSGDADHSWRDRGQLVGIANTRGSQLHGVTFTRHLHVGDTPMDMQAAVLGRAEPIGVLTGIYSREELQAAAPGSVVLDDLSDLEAVVKALDLWQ